MFNWFISDMQQYLELFNFDLYLQIIYIYMIYMYKLDLVLNNLQWLICHKPQPNQIIYI